MLEHIKNDLNYTNTENGAVTHKSTHSYLLDFFSLAGAMRNRSEEDIKQLFSKAFAENPEYAMKALFFMRDVRSGNGERRLFRTCMKWLAYNSPLAMSKNLTHVAEYGRWDDLLELLETPLVDDVIAIIRVQLVKDIRSNLKGDSVSLLAKWLPSENASSPLTKKRAKIMAKGLGFEMNEYRKQLSALRKTIQLVESKMSEHAWSDIDYSKVPSQAMLKYRQAFYRNDEEKYLAYLEALKDTGELSSVKINTKTLYPYQLVEKALAHRYTVPEMDLYNVMWENLPDVVGEDFQNSLAVIDVSGSMYGQPINVAISLGLYIAEKNKGKFKNHFITFSERPQLVEIIGANFTDKVNNIVRSDWGMNTNLKATFDLILDTAVKHRLPQSEMPSTLYIISDMEFDSISSEDKNTLFTKLKYQFKSEGYTLPRVVFWNVDARQNQAPVVKDEPNVQLISGFSHNLFASLIGQKEYNPYEFMMDVLDSERYKVITV